MEIKKSRYVLNSVLWPMKLKGWNWKDIFPKKKGKASNEKTDHDAG